MHLNIDKFLIATAITIRAMELLNFLISLVYQTIKPKIVYIPLILMELESIWLAKIPQSAHPSNGGVG
jgi:hypothetical protein